MKNKYDRPEQTFLLEGSGFSLRQRAETVAQEKSALSSKNIEALSSEKILQMFHELQVHQIELTIQNEELCRVQAEIEAV
ncbi:MAG: hypothetical protein Q7T90_09110, partial [Thiobacillus sp.]|nr:hypothetical protein [Thiobacillus sp.]